MSLVFDEKLVREHHERVFVETYGDLPDHRLDSYSILLFLSSRKNYYPEEVRPYVPSSFFVQRLQVKDVLNTEEFVSKVKRLDLPEGVFTGRLKTASIPDDARSYLEKHGLREGVVYEDGKPKKGLIFDIPKETMVIYNSLILHDSVKAVTRTMNRVRQLQDQLLNLSMKLVEGGDRGKYLKEIHKIKWNLKKLDVLYLSELHKSIGENRLLIIDIDTEDRRILRNTINLITERTGVEPLMVKTTHGGYHVIYNKTADRDFQKNVYLLFEANWVETFLEIGIINNSLVEMEERNGKTVIKSEDRELLNGLGRVIEGEFGYGGFVIEGTKEDAKKKILSARKRGFNFVKGTIELKRDPMTSVLGTVHGGVKVVELKI